MTDHCWYTVKIDVENAFNPSFVPPVPDHNPIQIWAYPASTVFNSDWLEYTKVLGITFKNGFIFYRHNYVEAQRAHIDTYYDDPTQTIHFGFNWVFSGGKGSKMIWYEHPKEKAEIKWTQAKTPYIIWPVTNLKPIEEYEIGNKLTLVKTGIPHEIYNIPENRWSMSARIDVPHGTSWDYIVDYLNERNLLESREV